MTKNPETVEDPLDGQLPRDVVGVIEHHIRVLEVSMTNLREHPIEPIGIHRRRSRERQRRAAGAGEGL